MGRATKADVEKLAYRPHQAAAAMGISRRKLYNLMGDGSLHSVKSGNARLIPRSAIERFLRGKPAGGSVDVKTPGVA
jgi:excisionase family DNA binding protein